MSIVIPSTVFVANANNPAYYDKLSCSDILCRCEAPDFDSCQCCCGCLTAFCFGSGLEWCCCYGCDKADCCAVCCAGFSLQLLSPFIFGVVTSCIVGCKMMID
ncbi:Cysteine-rich_membrane protein 2 [Hexamita inflata]|uniref:Cysteine-rich_membrane protein 2 n=1 Tax=Hexamita inflata TaxID=28002 RepID=A0ABP1GV85_9EUKA